MIILFLYKAAITRGNHSMDYPVEWLPFVVASFIVAKAEATETKKPPTESHTASFNDASRSSLKLYDSRSGAFYRNGVLFLFFNELRMKLTLALCDHDCHSSVADDVRDNTGHVQDTVDTCKERDCLERKIDCVEDDCQHDQT